MLDLNQRLFLWILTDRDTDTWTETASHTDTYTNTRIQSHSHLTNQNHYLCWSLALKVAPPMMHKLRRLHCVSRNAIFQAAFTIYITFPSPATLLHTEKNSADWLHLRWCCCSLISPRVSNCFSESRQHNCMLEICDHVFLALLTLPPLCYCLQLHGLCSLSMLLLSRLFLLAFSWRCWYQCAGGVGGCRCSADKPVLSIYPRKKEASSWHVLYRSADVLDVSFIWTIWALDFVYMQ